MIHFSKFLMAATLLLLVSSLLLGGCTNLNPVEPQNQPSPTSPTSPNAPTLPSKEAPDIKDVTVTYNYGDTGPVELSANNLALKVGQRLILQPAPGLTKHTRFTSAGDNFFGDIMEQQGDQNASGQLVFLAKKAGKGKLQVIPNNTDTARSTDLWVTVQ